MVEVRQVTRRNRLEPTERQLLRWAREGWRVTQITDRFILMEREAPPAEEEEADWGESGAAVEAEEVEDED